MISTLLYLHNGPTKGYSPMLLENVAVVKEAHDAKDANELLVQGWQLLGFVESTKDGGVTYVLGQARSRGAETLGPKIDAERP